MSSDRLQTLLDATVGDLVTADYDSAQDINALGSSLDMLCDIASAAGYVRITHAFRHAIGLIHDVAAVKASERAQGINSLNELFSAIQLAVRPGSDPDKANLPSFLEPVSPAFDSGSATAPDLLYFLPEHLDPELFTEYIADQEGVLATLENLLISIEKNPDVETAEALRRLLHTLKGEAGVFELRQVEHLCHLTEDLLDVKYDCIPVEALLTVKDWLKHCFDTLKSSRHVPPYTPDIQKHIVRDTYSPGLQPASAQPVSSSVHSFELSPFIDPEIFRIFIEEQLCALEKMEQLILLLQQGPDSEAEVELKSIFHTLNGGSGVCGLTDVEHVCCFVEDVMEKESACLVSKNLLDAKHWLQNVFDALKVGHSPPVPPDNLLEHIAQSCIHMPSEVSRNEDSSDGIFDDMVFNNFAEELQTLSAALETMVLKFEKHPDSAILDDLKRLFHTLKGESGVLGLHDIEKLCHMVEDLLETDPQSLRVDALLAAKDFLSRCCSAFKNHAPIPELTTTMLDMLAPPEDGCSIDNDNQPLAMVNNPDKGAVEITAEPQEGIAGSTDGAGQCDTFQNLLTADLDLLSDFVSEVKEHIHNIDDRLLSLENNPDDSDLLNAVFRVFHTIKGAAGFLALDDISRLSHITENLLDSARKGELQLRGDSIDVVFEAVDEMKNLVNTIEAAIASGDGSYSSSETLAGLIGKIKQVLSVEPVSELSKPVMKTSDAGDSEMPTITSGSIISEKNEKSAVPGFSSPVSGQNSENTDSAFAENALDGVECDADKFLEIFDETEGQDKEQMVSDSARKSVQQSRAKIRESIKVDAENLDKLIDAIGELVIIEAMIRQDSSIQDTSTSNMQRNIAQMNKIIRELQTLGMSLRMIPIKATFQKMARVVRDLAKKSNKKIEFSMSGEETMLDKSVVDRIGDPLIHLVRNAVDHGIEATGRDRALAGKDPGGEITLTAFHKGGNIYVEIQDDGRGLNREAIQERAIEKGLIREDHQLSDHEIYNLILLPGFSTARKVTDVSGRGVGMDVVKRTIEDLRGNIDITSNSGEGTTISLRLPLTLAIIDGMLVRIGEERYIIPTLSIVESVRPSLDDINSIANSGEMVVIRDKMIPLFRLSGLFNITGANQCIEDSIVIVVEDSGRKTGIMVDELLGQQSTVIKSLGALKGLTGISGGSIMSDGTVGIILDIAGIVKLAIGEKNIDENI